MNGACFCLMTLSEIFYRTFQDRDADREALKRDLSFGSAKISVSPAPGAGAGNQRQSNSSLGFVKI